MKQTLFVIDAYNLIYRMFYAIPEMHTREGIQVNAIFGVAKFLKTLSLENPDASVIVAADVGKSFRSDIMGEYKGTREKMPDNLRSQIDGVFSLFDAANITVIGREGYEADDIMGSIAMQFPNNDLQVVIISSDKDLCQFVRDDFVHIYDAMKRKFMREKDVLEKFGIPPEQVCDYLAIVGDTSDNIPGIAGIGPKKAKDLLEKYGSLQEIYNNTEDFTPKMQETLTNSKEVAFLSQQLATIVTDLKLEIELNFSFREKIILKSYQEILKKYEFSSLYEGKVDEIQLSPDFDVQFVKNLKELDDLTDEIIKSSKTIGLAVFGAKKIFVSKDESVFAIDASILDASRFVQCVLNGDISVAVYDAKNIFGILYAILYPEGENHIQDSLF